MGALNAARELGPAIGLIVFLIDAAKGAGSVWIAENLGVGQVWIFFAGSAAVIGHCWPVFLKFKGGKGIATSAGVLVAWVAVPLLLVLAVWIIVFLLSRYVSLASITAAAALPFTVWAFAGSPTMTLVTAGLGGLAIYKHKSNIKRLLSGTESRIVLKKGPSADAAKPTA